MKIERLSQQHTDIDQLAYMETERLMQQHTSTDYMTEM